jgi:hypothetical protein
MCFSFYNEGYVSGCADGERAGRAEGRIFGMEKGFEKFVDLGLLQGRCSVWKARLGSISGESGKGGVPKEAAITSTRNRNNIEALSLLLTNPPFKNDEISVEEVEEMLKMGRAKAKVLERNLGDKGVATGKNQSPSPGDGEQNIEDLGKATKTILDM